jgi:hypothetical protein
VIPILAKGSRESWWRIKPTSIPRLRFTPKRGCMPDSVIADRLAAAQVALGLTSAGPDNDGYIELSARCLPREIPDRC